MMRQEVTQRTLRLDLRLQLTGFGWFIIGAAFLFAWGWWISIVYDFGMADESWFLQVLTRVVRGDVLYRDVFFGATPLSVYLAAAFVRLFGSEIVVLKAVVALCFVLTVLLCTITLRQFRANGSTQAMLLLGTLAYVWPRQAAAYTPLAYTCLLGCLVSMVAWSRIGPQSHASARSVTLLALAGGIAGLGFGAKQNVGVYVLGAVFAVAVLWRLLDGGSWRSLCIAIAVPAAAWLFVSSIVVVPVLLSGGLDQFIDYGFVNKRTYLQVGGYSYRDGLQSLSTRARSLASLDDAHYVHQQTIFLLPPLTLCLLLAAGMCGTRQQRRDLTIAAIFLGTALVGVYPRADIEHVIYAVPLMLLCLVYAGSILASHVPASVGRSIQWSLVMWFMLGVGLVGAGGVKRMTSSDYERSTLPHFRGVWLTKREHTTLHRYLSTLQEASAGRPLFVLNHNAGFYYLAAGLDNPTPFDYPLVTAFGQHGQSELMAAITDGRFGQVCLTKSRGYQLAPYELEKFVAAHMKPVRFFRPCIMYQPRSSEAAKSWAERCADELYERGCVLRSRPSSR